MEFPKRKLPRLQGYDYSNQNYYYVTICTHNKSCIFGNVDNLNICGRIAEQEIKAISDRTDGVYVEKFVVMPNHIHAIIVIGCDDEQNRKSYPNLSTVIGLYKSGVSRRIHKINPQIKVWQSSFYDEIIRNDNAYQKVWQYIDGNPQEWNKDELYVGEW